MTVEKNQKMKQKCKVFNFDKMKPNDKIMPDYYVIN